MSRIASKKSWTKNWRRMNGMNQWQNKENESVFVRIEGNRVVRRFGNCHFNATPPDVLFMGDDSKAAKKFATEYVCSND